jgi:FeS assembly SUF system protein
MSDNNAYKHPASLAHLPVIPQNAKVEQFRRELREEPVEPSRDDTVRFTGGDQALRDKIIDAIRQVYDPEIPVNIYELGLIYAIDIQPQGKVHVRMTLTAPGCPVAGTLPAEVGRMIETVDEVTEATVELVWDPPWTKARMSEAAMLELGLM